MRVLRFLALCLAVAPGILGRWSSADEPADPLEPIAWAVGGRWVADIKTSDGKPMRVTATFRRSGNGKAITYDVRFKANDKESTQYEGMYFWHPGKKVITLVEVNAGGGITEGALKPEGKKLVQANVHTEPDGVARDQRVELVRQGEDSFEFEAFVQRDGKFERAVGFTYHREDEPKSP